MIASSKCIIIYKNSIIPKYNLCQAENSTSPKSSQRSKPKLTGMALEIFISKMARPATHPNLISNTQRRLIVLTMQKASCVIISSLCYKRYTLVTNCKWSTYKIDTSSKQLISNKEQKDCNKYYYQQGAVTKLTGSRTISSKHLIHLCLNKISKNEQT